MRTEVDECLRVCTEESTKDPFSIVNHRPEGLSERLRGHTVFLGGLQDQTIFKMILRHYFPFLFSFFHECAVEFARSYKVCDNDITLMTNGMCACEMLCFKIFCFSF